MALVLAVLAAQALESVILEPILSGQVSELIITREKSWKSDSEFSGRAQASASGHQIWDKVIPTGIKLSRTPVEALLGMYYNY
eukprot:SAG11_NODE_438_length_9463_cov_47.214957_10_plen_83_part_00